MKVSPYYIVTEQDIVTEVSSALIHILLYSSEELIGMEICNLFRLLKLGPDIEINKDEEYYLFTKTLEALLVNVKTINRFNKRIYYFLNLSMLNEKFPFATALCKDNYYGIGIFALPEMILMKASDNFFNFLDEPFKKKENCLGKRIDEFVTGFKGSISDAIWCSIIATGKPYYSNEDRFDRLDRGITYWRSSFTPIYENGKLKYCIQMSTEITDEVLSRRRVEKQQKELQAMLSNMSESLQALSAKLRQLTQDANGITNIFIDSNSITLAVLKEIGVPTNLKGYNYLIEAISLVIEDFNNLHSITKYLYPCIAKKYYTTSSRVERAIRNAIEVTWTRGNLNNIISIFGYDHFDNPRPSNAGFIAKIASIVIERA